VGGEGGGGGGGGGGDMISLLTGHESLWRVPGKIVARWKTRRASTLAAHRSAPPHRQEAHGGRVPIWTSLFVSERRLRDILSFKSNGARRRRDLDSSRKGGGLGSNTLSQRHGVVVN